MLSVTRGKEDSKVGRYKFMGFIKKTKYENIYEWAQKGEGSCFYCKEDKPIDKKFIGEKGICNECADAFKIGQIGADRHAIEHLSPDFKNHKEAVQWLLEHGANLEYKYKSNGIYFYDCINNEKAYKAMQEEIEKNGFAAMNEESMYSYNSVEISEDGHIHIVY